MKLRPEQLSAQLKKSLSPVYFITGDEPLILEESTDLLRHHIQQQGFNEREVLHVDGSFSWEYLLECANALSLFAEKKIIELRLGSQKLNKKSSDILQSYLSNPAPDNILLITADKLDGGAKKSAWFKAIDNCGVIVEIWPVEAAQLPNWIRQRAAQTDLQLNEEAIQLLCDRIEGNLLAAKQEISKLSLLFPHQVVTADDVIASVSDSSRYDIYGLTDAALNGQAARCLSAIQQAQQSGQSFDTVCQRERIWGKRKPLARQAAQRISTAQINLALQQCAEVDKIVKGLANGDAWLLLSAISLALAGQPLTLLNPASYA